jgi:lauroyl/myristoyl acyltransferase
MSPIVVSRLHSAVFAREEVARVKSKSFADLAYRIHAWSPPHRLVPMPLASELLRIRAAHAMADPRRRITAQAHMRYLLGRSDLARDAEKLAERYIYHVYTAIELLSRPWLTRNPIENRGLIDEAAAGGRGVLLHFLHQGNVAGMLASLGYNGIEVDIAASAPLLSSGHYRASRFFTTMACRGARLIPAATGSYALMVDKLRAGGIVAIASDIPGHLRVTFLDRDVMAASGVSRLGLETAAPIVVMTAEGPIERQRLVLHGPIDPANFSDGRVLLEAILAYHEPSVRARPWMLFRPLERWGPVPEDESEFGQNNSDIWPLVI